MSRRSDTQRKLAAVLALSILGLLGGEAAARREVNKSPARKAVAVKVVAQALLREGLAALAARDLAGAAQKLVAAYLDAPSLDCLYALGQLAFAEGKTLQAQDLMRRFLVDPLLEATPESEEYREAQRIVALPRPTYANLELQGARGSILKIDGRPVGALPLSAPILAATGEHSIDILAGDRELHEKVRLTAGRFYELRYNLSAGAFIINILPGALLVTTADGIAAPDQQHLRTALEDAVQKERYSPLSATADSKPTCQKGEDCMLKQARSLQAEYIVTAHAENRGADWQLTLELFDVEVGGRAATAESKCPGCLADKVAAKLAAMFSPLLKEAVDRPRGKVRIVSDPSGAEVTLDGRLAGLTPYEGPAFVGVHKVRLKRRRFHSEATELAVKENQTAESRIPLRDLPEPAPPPPCPTPPPCPSCPPPTPPAVVRVPSWHLATGILGISAGVLMSGLGTPAIALDGQCADDPIVSSSLCRNQFQTLPIGAALVGVGGALAVTGTVLLVFSSKRISGSKHK